MPDSHPAGPHVTSFEGPGGHTRAQISAHCPFEYVQMQRALSRPAFWCDIMTMPSDNHSCRMVETEGRVSLTVGIGGVRSAESGSASLRLESHLLRSDAKGFEVQLLGDAGPYGTTENKITLQLEPARGWTIVLMTVSFRVGLVARLASQAYFSTQGRDKVGFSKLDSSTDGLVAGLRGLAERNAMRYYLAMVACMHASELPEERRAEARSRYWLDATERYPRQLRELDRAAYLESKRQDARVRSK